MYLMQAGRMAVRKRLNPAIPGRRWESRMNNQEVKMLNMGRGQVLLVGYARGSVNERAVKGGSERLG